MNSLTDKIPLLIISLKLVIFTCASDENFIIITTKSGKLLGQLSQDRKGNDFYSFRSIPYAKAPVGPLRFKAPEPVEPWGNVLNATEDAPSCPQEHPSIPKLTTGQEDCLYLNVYTPNLPNTKNGILKAVMVFIHGGAFIRQTSSFFGPKYLLPADVVLVTINYRLGFFGFLNLEDQTLGIPGNAGLKDQVMALKWIKENIKYFGGDPNSITVFGESAGAASVHLLILSPMSKGLFHKAIAQSGCALNTWVNGEKNTALLLAKQLNITTSNQTQLLESLRIMPEKDILEAQFKLLQGFISLSEPWKTGVVIETQTNEPAFLPASPMSIIKSGNYPKVPLIIGYNDKEGLYMQIVIKKITGSFVIIKNFNRYLPYDLENRSGVGKIVKNFYNKDIVRLNNKILLPSINFITDIGFLYFIYKTAVYHSSKGSKTPVYFYKFSADTKLNLNKHEVSGFSNYTGASHGDILGYLFDTPLSPVIMPGSLEDVSVDRVVKMWTDFAKFSNPTPKSDALIGHLWKPFQPDKVNLMKIGNKISTSSHFEMDRVQFWDSIYRNYSKSII